MSERLCLGAKVLCVYFMHSFLVLLTQILYILWVSETSYFREFLEKCVIWVGAGPRTSTPAHIAIVQKGKKDNS